MKKLLLLLIIPLLSFGQERIIKKYWNNGALKIHKKYHENGNLSFDFRYNDKSEKHGAWRAYYKNGEIHVFDRLSCRHALRT